MNKATMPILATLPIALLLYAISKLSTSVSLQSDYNPERFYTCEPGFSLEVRDQAVRCIRQPKMVFVPLSNCKEPDTTILIDYAGKRDLCLRAKTEEIALLCPQGYQIFQQVDQDACVKPLSGAVTNPSISTIRKL